MEGEYSDQTGLETLEILSGASAFNGWLFDQILPFCRGNILEVGSGIGNISELLLRKGFRTTLSDLRPEYVRMLKKKFLEDPCVRGIYQLDLSVPDLKSRYPELLAEFDTLIALNVIEHIEKDELAVLNAMKLLKPGGSLIILVPAGAWLFNRFDTELGHFRRYSKRSLCDLLENLGYFCAYTSYFNLAGMAGWWFSGSVLKKKQIPEGQLKAFDRLVPLFRLLDGLTARVRGLSVIAVGLNQPDKNKKQVPG